MAAASGSDAVPEDFGIQSLQLVDSLEVPSLDVCSPEKSEDTLEVAPRLAAGLAGI